MRKIASLNMSKSIKNPILFFFFRTPEILVLAVFVYFAYYVLIDFKRDTLLLTSSAFAILATFTSLSFSFSRALANDKELSDRINFAGERFLHAGFLLIIASIIKWAAQNVVLLDAISRYSWLISIIIWLITIFTGILFFWAGMFTHSALKTLNPILLTRIARVGDWDTFF